MSQFILTHQGMLEGLSGLMLFLSVAFAWIGVPTLIAHSNRGAPKDPMYGTFFAKDYRHRPN